MASTEGAPKQAAVDEAAVDEAVDIKSTHTLILAKPPCCLEFAPLASEYFVVGTYNLVKDDGHRDITEDVIDGKEKDVEAKKQTRDGSLILCKVVEDGIKIIGTQPTAFGVLDIHFSPHQQDIFAVASSIGTVVFYSLKTSSETEPAIKHIATIQVTEDDIIVTSLAWHSTAQDQLVITLTNGDVGTVIIPPQVLHSNLEALPQAIIRTELNILYHHSLEAWTTIILPPTWPFSGILSGGDDAVLAYSPLPSNTSPTWSNRRIHGAGVTAILPLSIAPANTHIYLTGSYDDHLRVLSVPGSPGSGSTHQKQPQILHENDLEGGVWRLKLITSSTIQMVEGLRYTAIILVSCMYAGAKIVELSLLLQNEDEGKGGVWDSRVVATFREHESMCYACDVQVLLDEAEKGTNDVRTILSCSFYDKRLCLWRWHDRK